MRYGCCGGFWSNPRQLGLEEPRSITVHLPFIEQFVDLNRLTDLTTNLKPDDFEGLDRTALVEFRKALKRRAEGRPDDDWEQGILRD